MDGIMEQILLELKEIKLILKNGENGKNESMQVNQPTHTTLTLKQAVQYLGVTEWMLRTQCKQKKIKHFMAGNRFLFRKEALDSWLQEVQNNSIIKEEVQTVINGIRKIKP